MPERTSRAWTAAPRTPASDRVRGWCWGCRSRLAGRPLHFGDLWAGLLLGVPLFFGQFVLFVASQRLHEVAGPAAQGAHEVGYAPWAEDEEDDKDEQDLDQSNAHR